MARQTVDRLIKPNERGHARMRLRQTRLLDLRLEIEGVRKIAVREKMRETVENVRREIERLPDLARRAPPAISDHVRGHGRAVFPITPVDFLDDALPPVAAREIEIDVGPAFAALVQETLEDEIVAHRIDRGDPETKTNRAVRRAPPALDHDVVFAAEIDDVPDDQKIAGEPEPDDEVELKLELAFHFLGDRFVALLRAEEHERAQESIHRVPFRDRVIGEVVADVLERKLEAISQADGVGDRFRQIAKERFHFCRTLQVAFRVIR